MMRANHRLVAGLATVALMAGGGVAYAAGCPGMGDGTSPPAGTTGASGSTGTTGATSASTRHSKRHHAVRHATRG